MTGNVLEWCLNAYKQPSDTSLKGDASRVLRGGSWGHGPWLCRAAFRYFNAPVNRYDYFGFRLCCSSPIE